MMMMLELEDERDILLTRIQALENPASRPGPGRVKTIFR
jgi:hypothetical protein